MTADRSGVKPEQEYIAHLEAGRFMLLRSRASGRCMFYPRVAEPGTGATDLEWVEASGHGTVYSTTAVQQKPPKESYNVALIDLAEGPRMMSRVEGVPAGKVEIGMKVKARITRENDRPIVVFDPDW
ncbi:Zn-ribbon domain-containing OB-fold protein [Minwuia thermotolerans]|uniref:ChsH2 C-terminal OB-fold domain-containing protein n=1 Tax=Minwuia thermotolerans TaxID=2056226 RepID=A0A2M9FVH2_9PROT|nr:OB-fold domain-containing protein [Minwuia thermotolerans]PJK27446.1 hypothetical protein CVT23_21205 [Minwuia thermotolerans]